MDEYFNSIYEDLFYFWIIYNRDSFENDNIFLATLNPNEYYKSIIFELDYATGYLRFWQNNFIEEEILDQKGNTVFYLHFNIVNIKQFVHLFTQFYEVLCHFTEVPKCHIALCCSGGLSTSLFASKLQDLCDLQKLHYEFSAFGFNELIYHLSGFQAILLAPQIAYKQAELIRLTKNNIPVICINPIDFATNNFQYVINHLEDHLK